MSNDFLIIDYSPFSQESKVFINKDGVKHSVAVSSDISGLAEVLTGLAYSQNVYNIKIHAPLAVTNEISKQVGETESKLYSENKITVEGI